MGTGTEKTGLIELFKDFHSQAVEGKYPASVRALYNFLLGELNARFWATDELSYSERELASLVGVSKSAIHETVRYLCDRGWIKTSRNKSRTRTFFKVLTAQSTVGSLRAGTGQSVGSFGVSNYTRVKDVKDKEDKKDKKNSSPTATTRTREKRSTNSEEVEQTWFECEGERLKGGVALGLIELENEYGTTAVVDAILEAHRSNSRPRLSFNFVKAVLENQQKGVRQRGRFDNVPAGLEGGVWSNTELPPEINCGT